MFSNRIILHFMLLTAHYFQHQVPALDHDGVHMSESRDICKYLFENFSNNPANDHWYPKDPKKRSEVDEWLDWSKPLHLALEFGVVGAYAAPQAGCGWRANYGILIYLIGLKSKCINLTWVNSSFMKNLQADQIPNFKQN